MDTVSLSKNNRLFWLGRYAERVYRGVVTIHTVQDQLLDGESVELDKLRCQLDMEVQFATVEEFFIRYAYDRTLPESIMSSMDCMLGNGMVLREVLGSQTLSYLQMAQSALEAAEQSKSCGVQLQWVLDDIMAFRGSYGEYIVSEAIRNTIRCGASVERISSMLRFGGADKELVQESQKLINRLYKTALTYDEGRLKNIETFAFNAEGEGDRTGLLESVEYLFQV